jgi:hypothetical protein
MMDMFTVKLIEKLSDVLSQHGITLNSSASLYHYNELLSSILQLQHLERYDDLLYILESPTEDIEKFPANKRLKKKIHAIQPSLS